ncbi:hypothetical protein ABPG75_013168 [Micractinium tetrahymenae]
MAALPLACAATRASSHVSSQRRIMRGSQPPSASLAQLGQRQQRSGRRRVAAAAGLRVMATSEHWYEDEEEFDALTDAMKRKLVVLVASPAAEGFSSSDGMPATVDALRAFLQPLKFDQAFTSQQALPFAQQVWAGRDKAPYFLKVRQRAQLDAAAEPAAEGDQAAAAAAAAEGVWAELLQQNWRVELDAGLGGDAPNQENLLVFATPAAVARLLVAADCGSGGVCAEGLVFALEVEGTRAGDPLDWRSLGKRLALAAVQPGEGSGTVEAALKAAAATAAAQ